MINNFERKRSIFKNILVYISICLFFFLSIELVTRQNVILIFELLISNPIFVTLYLFVFFIFTSLYVLIFKRPLIALTVHYNVWVVLSFISSINSYFKGTPIIFEDLFLISEATDIASKYLNKHLIINLILLIVLIILSIILSFRLSSQYRIKLFSYKKKYINLILYILFIFTYLVSIDNLYIYGKSITYTLSDFDLNKTYSKNGFIYSFYRSTDLFLSNNLDFNYDVNTVLEIKSRLNNPKDIQLPNKNIVLIQLESLFDPSKLSDVKLSSDPLKNLHELSKVNDSGEIIVPVIGGGTIQTEFEILTGINIKNLYTRMPYLNLLNTTPVESIAYILRDYGYTTTALHNYFSTFYNRTKAYENLGFDYFVPIETIPLRDKNQNFWYKDDILIEEIISKIKNTPTKDFIFGVTVEAHGPYTTPIDGKIKVESTKLSERDRIELQNYVNIISEVDKFILNLKNALDSLGEEYILILYSDHLPALGENQSTFSLLNPEDLFKTPYLIIESNNSNDINISEDNIHSYDLLYEILSDMDLDTTIYHKFREEFKDDKDKSEYEYQLMLDIKPDRQNIYDNGEFPFEHKTIKLGVENPVLSDIIYENNKTILIGDNFTENSKVLVNNNKIETRYISKNQIELVNYIPKINDEIISIIYSTKNSPLNISNKFIYLK